MPCMRWPMKGSMTGYCKNHGGKTLKGLAHPNTRTGKHSKYQYLPSPAMIERAEELTRDIVDMLDESIRINATIETIFIERLGTGESLEAWASISWIIGDLDLAVEEEDWDRVKSAIDQLRKARDAGRGFYAVTKDVMRTQEAARKLIETAVKARKDRSETYTQETYNWMLGKLVHIIRTNVTDRPTLERIHLALQTEHRSRVAQLGSGDERDKPA